MSNGDGGVDVNIVIDLLPGLFPRAPRTPRGPRRDPNQDTAGTPFRAPPRPTIPGVPTQPGPFGTPPIFGPASNIPQPSDVVFRRGVTFGVGRLFGIGGLIITAAEILVDQLEKRQSERIQSESEEAFETAVEERVLRRRRLERDSAVRTIPTARADPPPGGFPDEPQQPFIVFPRIPLPEPAPSIPQSQPLPEVQPETVPAEVPALDPGRIATPGEILAPVRRPGTVVAPVEVPGTFEPAQLPGAEIVEPGIQSLQRSLIVDDLLQRTQPTVGDLTEIEAASVPSVGTVPGVSPGVGLDVQTAAQQFAQFSPQTQTAPVGAQTCPPPRQCDDDLEEPRFECFKGLYREGIFDTDFTPWAEIDCITGREL